MWSESLAGSEGSCDFQPGNRTFENKQMLSPFNGYRKVGRKLISNFYLMVSICIFRTLRLILWSFSLVSVLGRWSSLRARFFARLSECLHNHPYQRRVNFPSCGFIESSAPNTYAAEGIEEKVEQINFYIIWLVCPEPRRWDRTSTFRTCVSPK